ncbi:hypothetical protein [Streptomyces platensis]|uniref:hypothetical protein n=1 Tax=Streptomyces platensis TaxID=58346 RepID=UPI003327ACF1
MDDATRSWLLSQLGSDTNLADLNTRYTRLGRARAVAIEILNQRKADLIAQPSVIGVSSVVNINTTGNIAALERQIALLEADDAPLAPDETADTTDDSGSRFGVIRLIERRRR